MLINNLMKSLISPKRSLAMHVVLLLMVGISLND